MVGDYMSSSFSSDGNAHPAFVVAAQPTSGVFNQQLFSQPLSASGGAFAANEPVVFSGSAVHGSAPSGGAERRSQTRGGIRPAPAGCATRDVEGA